MNIFNLCLIDLYLPESCSLMMVPFYCTVIGINHTTCDALWTKYLEQIISETK